VYNRAIYHVICDKMGNQEIVGMCEYTDDSIIKVKVTW